ncbi:hypothetical protein EDD15DRAFT_1697433 [Pisolithus albus]|nr:hypothetical protein EDD15DRAFT_1697433 [Pisolithus albus]
MRLSSRFSPSANGSFRCKPQMAVETPRLIICPGRRRRALQSFSPTEAGRYRQQFTTDPAFSKTYESRPTTGRDPEETTISHVGGREMETSDSCARHWGMRKVSSRGAMSSHARHQHVFRNRKETPRCTATRVSLALKMGIRSKISYPQHRARHVLTGGIAMLVIFVEPIALSRFAYLSSHIRGISDQGHHIHDPEGPHAQRVCSVPMRYIRKDVSVRVESVDGLPTVWSVLPPLLSPMD